MCIILVVLIIINLASASNNRHHTSTSQHDAANYLSSSGLYHSRYSSSNASCSSCALNRTRRDVSGSGTCILPPYPRQGTYVVSGLPNSKPGQTYESFKLTLACRPGFGFVDYDGTGSTGLRNVFCSKGEWSEQMPDCVRFCKLDPDPSVEYTCHVPGAGFKLCVGYVPPGTRVRPVCNSPIYYSTDGLRNMQCTFGYWDSTPKCKAECGRVTPKAEQLVIGGEKAKRGELPWHAGIYTKTTVPYMQICGGSLVSTNVVISAAHCFWSDTKGKLPAEDFAVAMGKVYRPWSIQRDFTAQTSDVKELRIPRLFQGQAANLQEDIAVLILTTYIIYQTYVRPVCLNFDLTYEKWQLQHGKLGKVAGWGLTEADGKPSSVLKSVSMPYINEDICINTLPPSFREYITGDKFCAGYTNGTALCKGDSGGGLAFGDKEFGIDRFYLRGVVSAVPNDEDKLCNDRTYTTFTKISKHEEFIKEALSASINKTCPPNVFRCADGTCKDLGVDCNGRKDCADGSDETDELCVPVTIKGPPEPHRTISGSELYGILDQDFGAPSASMNKTCPPNAFRCADGTCKDQGVDCNGRIDCADGSDEAIELCVLVTIKTTPEPKPTISQSESSSILEHGLRPAESPKPDQPSTDRTTIMDSDCDPVASNLTSKKIGQKAFDKCIEYQEKYVYRCMHKPKQTPYRNYECKHNKREIIFDRDSVSLRDHSHWVILGYKLSEDQVQWAWPGSIISEKFVLTAASAVTSNNANELSYILTRSVNRESWKRKLLVYTHKIKQIITHPNYKRSQNYNDIALVEAEIRLPLSAVLVPACLHTPNSSVKLDQVSTWTLEWRQRPDLFVKLALERMTDSSCASKFPSPELPEGIKLETQICYENVKTSNETCVGKSGGTVETENPDVDCMYMLLGVTSITQCKVDPLKDYAVFTRVSPYIPWIESVVWPS